LDLSRSFAVTETHRFASATMNGRSMLNRAYIILKESAGSLKKAFPVAP
jgi:hypothetical protein